MKLKCYFACACFTERELIALLKFSSWCLVMVERLFLAVPRGCLQFVIVVFPDHTHLLFFKSVPMFNIKDKFQLLDLVKLTLVIKPTLRSILMLVK